MAALNAPMDLLHRIGGARANLVFDFLTQLFLDCPWVGGQAIGGDLIWSVFVNPSKPTGIKAV